MSLPNHTRQITFGQAVKEAIAEEMRRDERVLVMGEDGQTDGRRADGQMDRYRNGSGEGLSHRQGESF